MSHWKQVLREGAIAGSLASVASAAALLAAGRRDNGHAAAPVNAISHWVWDRPALLKNRPSLRHTLVGYLVHHGASFFWAILHARAWCLLPEAKKPAAVVAGAAATSAIACVVDYCLTPRRLTPGFEHRLSLGSMAAVYICFALGLALGSIAAGHPLRHR
jgi:hypothetical protein